MAKVTVYHKETGKQHEVDSVDAKEYVESGSYTRENPNAEAEVKADPEQAVADEAVRQQRAAAMSVAGAETAPKASRKK